MSLGILATIAAIAAVDGLNPMTIVGCAYLLSTPSPLRRTMAFIAGVFAMYFGAGALVLALFGEQTNELLGHLQSGMPRAIVGVLIGLALTAFAAWHWHTRRRARSEEQPERRPRSLSLTAAFVFGFTMTLSDAPTAFPYLGALGLIAQVDAGALVQFGLLFGYNVVFVGPALALVALWRRSGRRGVDALERARVKVQSWFASPHWAYPLALAGVLIAADGVFQVATGAIPA